MNRLSLGVYFSNQKVLTGELTERNSVLHIRAKSQGVSICTVYLIDNPMIFDIFVVMVGSVITPISPVSIHEGGSIQFSVTSPVKTGTMKRWFSEEEDIVEINPVSGKAFAKKEGKTHIQFSDVIHYNTRVNVFRANRILVDTDIKTMTNIVQNIHYRDEYRVNFRIFSDDKEIDNLYNENDPINNNLKPICESTRIDLFDVTPVMTADNKPSCIVKPRKTYSEDAVKNILLNILWP